MARHYGIERNLDVGTAFDCWLSSRVAARGMHAPT